MNVVVAVISPAPAWVMPRRFVEQLRRDFPQHTFLDAWDRDTLRRLLPEADVAFTPFIDRDVFASAARLRWVQSPAAGVGSLMFPELIASEVVLTSARGIRARSIAEHVLGVTIALARRLPATLRAQAAHHWAQEELETETRTLQGQRMGIIGLGAIGLEVVKIAAPFGFRVSGIRRRAGEPVPDGVDEVWTPDEAVVEALRDGRLGGAALDVFSQEPLEPSSPYWDLPNVIVTPHTSGAMQDYWTPLVALFADNLRRFEKGEPLRNVVDKVAGY
jgi:phosphoglycerate dehydrogenase-like enzyme